MKLNENITIFGKNAVLVPYEAKHVPKYHMWMKDEEIQRLTGSEPLSIEEEYDMQKTWRNDEDKLTFIVLDKSLYDVNSDEILSMAGDVNLFINQEEQEAEAEVMIAEPTSRRKGIALESLKLLISYALKHLPIKKFIAKIVDDNSASMHLFQEKLGFEIVSHSSVFKEYTLEIPASKMSEFKSFIDSFKVEDKRL